MNWLSDYVHTLIDLIRELWRSSIDLIRAPEFWAFATVVLALSVAIGVLVVTGLQVTHGLPGDP